MPLEIETRGSVEWGGFVACNMCTVLAVSQAVLSDRSWGAAFLYTFALLADRSWHPARRMLADYHEIPEFVCPATIHLFVAVLDMYMLTEAATRPASELESLGPLISAISWLSTAYATTISILATLMVTTMVAWSMALKAAKIFEATGCVGTVEIGLNDGKIVIRPRSLIEQIEVIAPAHRNEEPPEGAEPCSICLNPLSKERFWRETPCRHLFHADCADFWWQSHQTCPMCNQRIQPREAV